MKASIDIGSNTVLLLIGEVRENNIEIIHEQQAAPRLGQGVDADKNVSKDAMQRVMRVLKKYLAVIKKYDLTPEQVQVVATSAVRDAQNRDEFVDQIKAKTGFLVDILSGEEEARHTYIGAQSVLEQRLKPTVVIDIGGGSTEVIYGKGDEITERHSFDMGCVRFTERYLTNQPVDEVQIERCRREIARQFNQRTFALPDETVCVGVAGTVTSLASIKLGLHEYKPEILNGYRLTAETISSFAESFCERHPDELLQKYSYALKGRADIILAGVLILSEFLACYNLKEVIVSTGGIRHGVLFDQPK